MQYRFDLHPEVLRFAGHTLGPLLQMDRPTSKRFDKVVSSSLARSRVIAVLGREGGREGGRGGGMETGREGGRQGGREGWRERGREGGWEGARDGGKGLSEAG